MASRLQIEIKQTRPFRSAEQEAYLNLLRTVEVISGRIEPLFAASGLSSTQYNVLRILRGAGEALPCSEIASRMIHRDPDMTRLLDRLEKLQFISRRRGTEDRRVVFTEITAKALQILESLDEPVIARLHEVLGHLGKAKLKDLTQLLEEARQGNEHT